MLLPGDHCSVDVTLIESWVWLLVPAGLRAALWNRLTAARRIATGALAVSLVALLPLRTVLIGDGWASATDPQMLFAVVTATNIGTAWSIQVALSAALPLALALLPAKAAPAVITLLSAGLLASLSLTGHAAMNAGWLGLVQQVNDGLHLLAAGFWIGALPVVLMLLPQLAASGDTVVALKRFSNAGHLAVALVVLSGIASTVLITGRFPPEPTSAYQTLLLAKMALVAAMVLIP